MAYKKQQSEVCLGSYAVSKIDFFITFVNGFQLLTNVTKKCVLAIAGALDPRLTDTQSYKFYNEYFKSGQNLAPPSPPLLREQKQLNILTHQTRDQTAIDLFLVLLLFSSSAEVLSLLALDFYNRGHLHFLSAPLQVVHPLFLINVLVLRLLPFDQFLFPGQFSPDISVIVVAQFCVSEI